MNLRGSYRALQNNSKAAMLAAIEIYNKPQIAYRDECFSILLVNAWELLLKSILSKDRQRIFYRKKRNEPYRSFTVHDALNKAKDFFPSNISYEPVAQNLNMLITYRNNSIHFYNQREFSILIYGLAQTSIINYRDLMLFVFNIDIANEMTLSLLPLSFGPQPNPIQFIQRSRSNPPKNRAVAQFLRELSDTTRSLEQQGCDTSRFLTIFTVNLQSVKKISTADVIVGVGDSSEINGQVFFHRQIDPNRSHPIRQTDILTEIGSNLNGVKFTTFTFQAIAWKYDFKNKPHLYWRPDRGGVTQYSRDVPSILRRLSQNEIEQTVEDFKKYRKRTRRTRRHSSGSEG